MNAIIPLRGIVHGKTIELDHESGLPEGAKVSVVVQLIDASISSEKPTDPLAGLRASFGGWANDADGLDEYLEWNRQQR